MCQYLARSWKLKTGFLADPTTAKPLYMHSDYDFMTLWLMRTFQQHLLLCINGSCLTHHGWVENSFFIRQWRMRKIKSIWCLIPRPHCLGVVERSDYYTHSKICSPIWNEGIWKCTCFDVKFVKDLQVSQQIHVSLAIRIEQNAKHFATWHCVCVCYKW